MKSGLSWSSNREAQVEHGISKAIVTAVSGSLEVTLTRRAGSAVACGKYPDRHAAGEKSSEQARGIPRSCVHLPLPVEAEATQRTPWPVY